MTTTTTTTTTATLLSLLVLMLQSEECVAQPGVTRVCSLQLVVDHLLWSSERTRVASQASSEEEQEISRLTRYTDCCPHCLTDQVIDFSSSPC